MARYELNDNCECSYCGQNFIFDDDDCEIYNGKPICSNCFQDCYGYCEGCGKLNKYEEMNDNIYCSQCQKELVEND